MIEEDFCRHHFFAVILLKFVSLRMCLYSFPTHPQTAGISGGRLSKLYCIKLRNVKVNTNLPTDK